MFLLCYQEQNIDAAVILVPSPVVILRPAPESRPARFFLYARFRPVPHSPRTPRKRKRATGKEVFVHFSTVEKAGKATFRSLNDEDFGNCEQGAISRPDAERRAGIKTEPLDDLQGKAYFLASQL